MYLHQHIGGRVLLARRGVAWRVHYAGRWGGEWATAADGLVHIGRGTTGHAAWDVQPNCGEVPADLAYWRRMPDGWAAG